MGWPLKIPSLREFGGKIEILSTHNVLCWNFAAVCQKSYFNRQRSTSLGSFNYLTPQSVLKIPLIMRRSTHAN